MPFEFFFPKTFYYRDELISEDANRELVEEARALRQEFPNSTRQNLYTTFGSLQNVLERAAFSTLRDALREEVILYLEQIETPPGKRLVISNAWIGISSPGNYERMHIHPGSYVSGVYYLKAPKDSGRIFFENLDDNLWCSERTRRENLNAVSYEPLERRLILFNSQVPHHVGQNRSDLDRIALSFNVALT